MTETPTVPHQGAVARRSARAREPVRPSQRQGTFAATVADQVLCALTSLVVLVLAVRTLHLRDLGTYYLVFGAYVVVVATVRSLCLEVMLSHYATRGPEIRREATRLAAGAASSIGVVMVVVCAAATVVATGEVPSTALLATMCIAVFLVQDAWRFYWIAAPSGWGAVVSDGGCLLAVCTGAVAADAIGTASVDGVLVVWGLGGCVGAVLGAVQLRAVPRPRAGIRWMLEHRSVGLPLAGGAFARHLAIRTSLAMVGAIAGLAALGRLGAAMAILAPMNALITAVGFYGVAEASRRVESGSAPLGPLLFRITAALAAGTLALSALYMLTPDQIGTAFLGTNWLAAGSYLLPVTVWVLSLTLIQGPLCGLRALGRNHAIFALALFAGCVEVLCALVGGILAGGAGAAWGLAGAGLLCVAPYLWAFWRAVPGAAPRLAAEEVLAMPGSG